MATSTNEANKEVKRVESERLPNPSKSPEVSVDTENVTVLETAERDSQQKSPTKAAVHPPPDDLLQRQAANSTDSAEPLERLTPSKNDPTISKRSKPSLLGEKVDEQFSSGPGPPSTEPTFSRIKVEATTSITDETSSGSKNKTAANVSSIHHSSSEDEDFDVIDLSIVKHDENVVLIESETKSKTSSSGAEPGHERTMSGSSTSSSRLTIVYNKDEVENKEQQSEATTSGIAQQDLRFFPTESPASSISSNLYPLVLDLSDSNSPESNQTKGPTTEPQLPSTIDNIEDLPTSAHSDQAGERWWQYGVLAKGPKGASFDIDIQPSTNQRYEFQDPAAMKEIYPSLSQAGRTRLGEGNDITPNPRLLKKLKEDILEISTQLQLTSRSNGKKRKMNLSSRLARMRRRANHEANKIIYAGITAEREALLSTTTKLHSAVNSKNTTFRLTEYCKSLTENLPHPVAGKKVEYIDGILEKPEDSEESE